MLGSYNNAAKVSQREKLHLASPETGLTLKWRKKRQKKEEAEEKKGEEENESGPRIKMTRGQICCLRGFYRRSNQ